MICIVTFDQAVVALVKGMLTFVIGVIESGRVPFIQDELALKSGLDVITTGRSVKFAKGADVKIVELLDVVAFTS